MIPDELRHAFPEPDERFQACVRRTLDGKSETLLLNRTSHARRVTAFGKSASVAAKGWTIV